MSKSNQGKVKRGSYSSGSLGDLVSRAIKDRQHARSAYAALRSTYLKEVRPKEGPKTKYWDVFPRSVLISVSEKPRAHTDEHERLRDFKFSVQPSAICFARSLWFAHQFFSKPLDVLRFFQASKAEKRLALFKERLDELRVLAETYAHWTKTAPRIVEHLNKFDATKTDLLTLCDAGAPTTAPKDQVVPIPGSAAVADFIREVEQRASYQAGDPGDACEKALYFLALGRPEIAERIAAAVLQENPDHPIALYANAVLLLDASERHQRQAFFHDVMHPHGLEPIEAEEFYHLDRHVEESRQAQEKERRAFLLMLRARQHWPKQFSIKCYDLAPSMWQHKVDEWILRQAAARLGNRPEVVEFSEEPDNTGGSKELAEIVSDIWKTGRKSMLKPFSAYRLPNFIIVASLVQPNVARDCLNELDTALREANLDESQRLWRDPDVVLPVAPDASLAETLMSAAASRRFSQAISAVLGATEAADLLCRIAQTGLGNERDRRAAVRSMAMREMVLNISQCGGSAQAAELCREMAERFEWPASETGEKLQACWRYAVLLMHFEASRAALEANDLREAVKFAGSALAQAASSFAAVADEQPLLKFIDEDEYGESERVGDFLHREGNIVTGCPLSDFPPPLPPRGWVRTGSNTQWDDLVKWADERGERNTPLLLAYGRWLAFRHGQPDLLLAQCDALMAAQMLK